MQLKTRVIIFAILIGFSQQALAQRPFLERWESIYPESTSSQRECQLCHQNEDGGDGWNTYGITIRVALIDLFGRIDIDAAIRFVENENADNDKMGLSNLSEIMQGLDPGWRAGNVNTIDFKNGDFLLNQPPPFSDVDGNTNEVSEDFCFAIKNQSNRISLICI